MPVYKAILLLHVLASMMLSACLAVEWSAWTWTAARHAPQESGRALKTIAQAVLGSLVCVVVIAASGAFMVATAWKRQEWIVAAMVALPPFMMFPALVTLRKVLALVRRPRDGHGLSAGVQAVVRGCALQLSLRVRSAIVLGIAYLMVVKPTWGHAALAMSAFVAAGVATAIPFRSSRP